MSLDPAQLLAQAALQRLALQLAARPSWWSRWLGTATAPRGLYLHGPVGRGKTMLMDEFYAKVTCCSKRRVHFHTFMLEVHQRVHAQRQQVADPILAVAQDIASETRLLCFDEFQVTDVADAMILARLFTELVARKVVVVATSNTPPAQLYENGLQRQLFLPFIALLTTHCQVMAIDGGQDYRRLRLQGRPVYYTPENDTALAEDFALLTDQSPGQPQELEVAGRKLTVPRAAHGVAWFTFAQLCEQPLGSADYAVLVRTYSTFLLSGVPAIRPEARNSARRLITFIDLLYDARGKIIISAAVPPDGIYPEGLHSGEFARTLSRLSEMQSQEYWQDMDA